MKKQKVQGSDYENWHRQLPITNFQPINMQSEQILMELASALSNIQNCPLNWLLQTKCAGNTKTQLSQNIGTLIHEIAQKYPNIKTSREIISKMK